MSKKSKRKTPNTQRQDGSLKVWQDERNGYFWLAVDVHKGRVTKRVRGPVAREINVAQEFLRDNLKDGRV